MTAVADMSLLSTHQMFEEACRELEEPQLEGGWELFTETMGVKIYRLYHRDSGLYEYKVLGLLPAHSPELCTDVYMDLTYRKKWDKYVKELHEKDNGGQPVIYWEVKYPFPLSNRDYVYVRERRDVEVDGRPVCVVVAKSVEVPACPQRASVIRVTDYRQSVAMESDGAGGTRVFLNYFDNPGGLIPTWLVNWAAKSGVPGFLTDMQKACKGYVEYCRNVQTSV